ncbi:Mif2/CENP-C like-domain-containing protein [Schizophyllum amplum]|uniref:CENP-C homolog n=1 Tax=Schizophyllum amplum TaxID=97359 RepID=A0A550C300_9AGAR|nr:Mif2/CENP-C like-domain-containing protein [Auriculariopsis ampla]
MPQTPRRSSISSAALRLNNRPHVPFSNDPTVGRKTGRAFREVERDEDGFEPYERVASQGDQFTPPRVQPAANRKRRRKSSMPAIEEDDDYGEQSMEIDSPLVNTAQPTSPALQRKNASSRTLRYSDDYYDEIPSVTTSATNASARSSRPSLASNKSGRSRLSLATSAVSFADDDDDESDNDNAFDLGAGYDHPDDPEDEPATATPSLSKRKSFSQMNQDDDEEEDEEEEEEAPPEPTPKKKGKERAPPEPSPESDPEPDQDQEMEPDYGNDMNGGDMEDQRSDTGRSEGEQEDQPPPKRKRNSDPTKISRSRKENRPIVEGTRRSSRPHIKPLEYWRGEKYVYGRTESHAPVLTAPIKEIRRIAPEPVVPLGQKRRRGTAKPRSKSAAGKTATPAPASAVGPANPEEGWDDETDPFGFINDIDLNEEVKRRIIYTAKMVQTAPSANGEWAFDRIFSDANFMAAGMITIIPNGRKSTKPTKDNTYIFYVIEGAVNVRIHVQSAVVATGGMFMVPRGNSYFIENISDRETRLFFVQARKNVEPTEAVVVQDGSGVSRTSGRSSAGAISGATDRSSAALKRATTSRT